MDDDGDYFVLSDIVNEAIAYNSGSKSYDEIRCLQLIDQLLLAAEDEPSEYVIDPALNLCDILIGRNARESEVYFRQSQLHFHLGSFVLSRQLLDQAELGDDVTQQLQDDIDDFRDRLQSKVTRDGRISLIFIGGLISALTFWWLQRRKLQRDSLLLNNNNTDNNNTINENIRNNTSSE